MRHGAAAIEPLLALLQDDDFSAIHAARLLGRLKATQAIEPLVQIIFETDWDDMLHDAAILALGDIGPAIVEPVLARLPDADAEDVRPALLGALASCGANDERVYTLLLAAFEQEAWQYASELAAYGDARAIAVISRALDESRFGTDREDLAAHAVIELCDAIEELGGKLTDEQQRRLTQVGDDLQAQHAERPALSSDDLELAEFLSGCEDAMTLAETKGFLTAVVTRPTLTLPSDWLSTVIGDEPAFSSRAHAERIFGLVMTLHNSLIEALQTGRAVAPAPNDPDLENWCSGYLDGAEADAAWTADEDARMFLFPMAVLLGEFSLVGEADADGKIIEDATPQLRACRERLDRTVHEAYQYWLARRTAPPVSKTPKVGRNEPCPCGSGKKFKKCCELTQN